MTIERAVARPVAKPWGVADLLPWSHIVRDDNKIGEIWYGRSDDAAPSPSLLLKLLFTSEPLSIQVHPSDAYAQSIGLPNGKTEAWYILGAAPGAQVALGLKQSRTQHQLRRAIDDDSISDLVEWHAVNPGDCIFVPAGTIHAIGAGLVLAEIQQRSDATFRMFDYGRGRNLHVENAVATANLGPPEFQIVTTRPIDARTHLIANAHFAFERIDLPPGSAWSLEAKRETWLLVVGGSARASSLDVAMGDAIFAKADCVDLLAGPAGLIGLVAYVASSFGSCLLESLRQSDTSDPKQLEPLRSRVPLAGATPKTMDGCMEITR